MTVTERRRPALKKRINLTIDEELILAAKDLGLNASNAAESGLRAAVRSAREEQWLRENKSGIDAHNERVEKHGTLLKPLWLEGDAEI
jgi:antitoxin CcdA